MLAVLLPLLDRLEGLALASSQPPFLSGSFHGQAYYKHFVQPLDTGWRGVNACCVTVSKLTASLLRNPDAIMAQKLHDAITALIHQRQVFCIVLMLLDTHSLPHTLNTHSASAGDSVEMLMLMCSINIENHRMMYPLAARAAFAIYPC